MSGMLPGRRSVTSAFARISAIGTLTLGRRTPSARLSRSQQRRSSRRRRGRPAPERRFVTAVVVDRPREARREVVGPDRLEPLRPRSRDRRHRRQLRHLPEGGEDAPVAREHEARPEDRRTAARSPAPPAPCPTSPRSRARRPSSPPSCRARSCGRTGGRPRRRAASSSARVPSLMTRLELRPLPLPDRHEVDDALDALDAPRRVSGSVMSPSTSSQPRPSSSPAAAQVADEAAHGLPRIAQRPHDVAADESRSARDEDHRPGCTPPGDGSNERSCRARCQRARGPVCQKTSAAAVASASTLSAATSLSEIGHLPHALVIGAAGPLVESGIARGRSSLTPAGAARVAIAKVRIDRTSAETAEAVQRTAPLRWPSRDRPVRPPARPLRVLDPRRGVPDPGARAEGGRARDARRLAHRPRLDGRRDRPLQGRRRARASSRSSAARCTSSTTARALTKGHAHLTLLAADNTGYANLIKLCSLGYLEGYYYKPRVDWELLERHAPGMIALSGCLSGRVSRALSESRDGDAEAELDRLAQIFGRDNTYVELQNVGLDVQQAAFLGLPEARRAARAAARRDRRRPLPRRDRRAQPRRAPLHPVGRLAQEPEPLAVRRRRVLLQDPRGDGARLPRARGRDAPQPRGRRALQRRARARPDPAAELPGARRAATRSTTSSSCARRASSSATAPRPRSSTSGCGSSSRPSARWASRTTS